MGGEKKNGRWDRGEREGRGMDERREGVKSRLYGKGRKRET